MMKKQSRILFLFLSLLLAASLLAAAAADAPYAEINAGGKSYKLSVTDCLKKTRNMYVVTVQGYNMAADSDGGGFTVDEEHLPFVIAAGSDPVAGNSSWSRNARPSVGAPYACATAGGRRYCSMARCTMPATLASGSRCR